MIDQFVDGVSATAARFEVERGLKTEDDEIMEDRRLEQFLRRNPLVFGLLVLDPGFFADAGKANQGVSQDLIGVLNFFLYSIDHHWIVGSNCRDDAGANFRRVENSDASDAGSVCFRDPNRGFGCSIGVNRSIEGYEYFFDVHKTIVSRFEELPLRGLSFGLRLLSAI